MAKKLYHGTCKAFVDYAKQNKGQFGPDYDTVSFTPSLEHAKTFAESWNTERGKTRLRTYFGDSLDYNLTEPVILTFDVKDLGDLNYREDCGEPEFYKEQGPISLDLAV